MRKLFLRYPIKTRRLLEFFIPSISWFLITMPFWLSFWHPAVVAYFVIAFDVYWFYKSASLAFHAVQAYLTISAHSKINWLEKAKKIPHYQDIHHVIIIPEYREPLSVLRETIANLTKQDFPKKNISLVLATEARDSKAADTAAALKREFGHYFSHFWITRHPHIPGEVAGKSSNMAYAGRWVTDKLLKLGMDLKKVIVTSCDADVILHPKYLSYLTYSYLKDPERLYHFYQSGIVFYNNIWRIPLPGRVLNTIGSIFNLSLLRQETRLVNFSTYSLSLATVKKVGFWGVDVIPEDYHLFFKTYFKLGAKVKVKPIFLPSRADAAESHGLWATLSNQYQQYKRWAWGISDVPEVIKNYFLHPEIPFLDRTIRVLNLLEQHILWPTNWFILTLGSTIPPLINPYFARTVLGHNLSQISSAILTLSAVFLIVIIILDLKAKPAPPKTYSRWKTPLLYLQWLTLPIVSFFLSALPGLDAHTRLMLGKRLEYRVTEKVR